MLKRSSDPAEILDISLIFRYPSIENQCFFKKLPSLMKWQSFYFWPRLNPFLKYDCIVLEVVLRVIQLLVLNGFLIFKGNKIFCPSFCNHKFDQSSLNKAFIIKCRAIVFTLPNFYIFSVPYTVDLWGWGSGWLKGVGDVIKAVFDWLGLNDISCYWSTTELGY